MRNQAYKGRYRGVYPIKVNQQRGVINALLQNGQYPVGLEAGSKSELLAILALSDAGTVICNGYKDRSYIRLALIGRTLGLNVFIVVEKLSELGVVLSESANLGIEPQLGVRIRLSGLKSWRISTG
jgi:arginine decarboxylase